MLQTLDLAGNQIGDEGTKALAEAVKNNKVKCILSIHWYHYHVYFLYRYSLCSIWAEMKLVTKEQNNSALLYKRIRWIAFSIHLFHYHPHFSTQKLTKLLLHKNRIRDNGVSHLATALDGDKTVKCIIYLSFSFISVLLYTETQGTPYWLESNRRWRSKPSRESFKKKHGKMHFVSWSMPLSLLLFHTETRPTRHWWKSNRRERDRTSRQCFKRQQGETHSIDSSVTLLCAFSSYRSSPNWMLTEMKSEMKVQKNSSRYIAFSILFSH